MASADAPVTGRRSFGTRSRYLVILVVLILAVAVVLAFRILATPPPAETTSTYYSIGPGAVVSAAAGQSPDGYVLESSNLKSVSNPTEGGAWAILGKADGSTANMTVIAFSTTEASQGYYSRLLASGAELSGYTDASSYLGSFQQYGMCHANGEDVDGVAVVNGVCAKGNLILEAHLASSIPLAQLEAEMSDLIGSMYGSAR